ATARRVIAWRGGGMPRSGESRTPRPAVVLGPLTTSTVRPHNVNRDAPATGGLDRVPGATLAARGLSVPDGDEAVDPAQHGLVRLLVGFPPGGLVRHVADQRRAHQEVVELVEVVRFHLRLAVVDRGKYDFEPPAGLKHDLGEDLVCASGEARDPDQVAALVWCEDLYEGLVHEGDAVGREVRVTGDPDPRHAFSLEVEGSVGRVFDSSSRTSATAGSRWKAADSRYQSCRRRRDRPRAGIHNHRAVAAARHYGARQRHPSRDRPCPRRTGGRGHLPRLRRAPPAPRPRRPDQHPRRRGRRHHRGEPLTDTSTTQPSVRADTALLTILGALDRMVRDRQIPGGVIAAGTVETAPAHATSGVVSPGGAVAPKASTLYDVASLTKVVATWPLVGDAVSRGLVDLDTPMWAYFPSGASGDGGVVTAREILTHTSGLIPSTRLDLYSGEARDIAEAILSEPLDAIGRHRYINRGFILLGLLLARVEDR